MSQKLQVNKFDLMEDTFQSNTDFMKNFNEEGDERYFLEFDVQYIEKLHELHNDLPFVPKRIKIEKVENLVANSDDKTEYAMHIINLK